MTKRNGEKNEPLLVFQGGSAHRVGGFLFIWFGDAGQVSRPQPPGLAAGPAYQPPGLVYGAAFKDRILPMSIHDGLEEEGIWGADVVIPRDIHNGIEDPQWSYWCISGFKASDNRYYMYVCRWPSDDPCGHGDWPQFEVVYSISDKPTGLPLIVKPEQNRSISFKGVSVQRTGTSSGGFAGGTADVK